MKDNKTLFFLILILIVGNVANGCREDDPVTPTPIDGYADIDVVTGLDFYDANGAPLGRWKFPNNNPGEVRAFPNPSTGVIAVFSQQAAIQRVWLVPAECLSDSVTVDIPSLSQGLSYEISELEEAQVRDLPVPNLAIQFSFDFSTEPPGFYRLFCQMDTGELFWENLYFDPSASNFPSFGFLDGLCN